MFKGNLTCLALPLQLVIEHEHLLENEKCTSQKN